jgi:hypothetical protein
MGFDFAPYSGAVSSVSDLVSGVVKRIWPEKMSELDKAKLEQETALFIMSQQGQNIMNEFSDRASARKLAEADIAKGSWFTTCLAAAVRPVGGFTALLAFFAPLAARVTSSFFGHVFTPEQIAAIQLSSTEKEIVLSIIYFYFGGRVVERGIAVWTGSTAKSTVEKG